MRRLKTIGTILLLLWVAGAAQAEVQRVEAIGTYGIRRAVRNKVIARDEAIARGLWEGVSRVALELIGESASEPQGSSSVDQTRELERALGKDILPYTRSFRILKDKGEKPVMFAEDPRVKTEYVVVVEVIVDVDRVSSALERAGLVAADTTARSGEMVTLEILGLDEYGALMLAMEALRDRHGATQVDLVELTRERQVLYVRGPFGAQGLSDRLARGGDADAELAFEPIAVDPDRRAVRVRGRWSRR